MVLWMYERLDQLYTERFERPRHDEGHCLASAPSAARAWQQSVAEIGNGAPTEHQSEAADRGLRRAVFDHQ
jgi:hypothetical protein